MAAQQANQTEVPQRELFQWQESHPEIHNNNNNNNNNDRLTAFDPGQPG